jgi:transporter family protein
MIAGYWQFWAALSAVLAAMTAILAKLGVAGVNSDFATLVRTAVILPVLGMVVLITGQWQSPATVNVKTWLFLGLSGLATGASWVCYFRALKLRDASKVAPLDKMSVVLVALFAAAFLGERLTLPNWLGAFLLLPARF